MYSGILVLEAPLIESQRAIKEPTAKRAKHTVQKQEPERVAKEDMDKWLELGRLYKSLSDYDVLRGIFSDRLSAEPRTRDAIKAEMKLDFLSAAKIYTQVCILIYALI